MCVNFAGFFICATLTSRFFFNRENREIKVTRNQCCHFRLNSRVKNICIAANNIDNCGKGRKLDFCHIFYPRLVDFKPYKCEVIKSEKIGCQINGFLGICPNTSENDCS